MSLEINPYGNIAFAADLNNISGIDAVHFNLSKGLEKQDISTFFLPLGPTTTDFQKKTQSTVFPINAPSPLLRFRYPRGSQWSQFCIRYYREKVQTFIRNNQPAWWIAGHLNYLWFENLPNQCKQLGIIHAPDEGNLKTIETYHKYWDSCVAVSEESANAAIKRVPDIEKKIHIIPNGIEIPEYKPVTPSQKLSILWCGRIEQEQKRVMDLVSLVEELKKKTTGFTLKIIGDGPEEDALTTAMQPHIRSGHVELLGRKDSKEIQQLMSVTDMIFLVSNYEGTPMSMLEGMSKGCIPVTSTGCGGLLPLMQDSFDQNLFNPGNMVQAANIITSYQQADKRKQMKQATHEHLRKSRHSLDAMTEAYMKVLF